MTDEKLCLKWNNFQDVLKASVGDLRVETDFTDVTLACEDQSFKAHKVILSACSPFFKRLLKSHAHPQPLVYMRGIRASEMVALLDFIYYGEANIFQEQLDSILALAKEIELKGLSGNSEEVASELPKCPPPPEQENFPSQDQHARCTECGDSFKSKKQLNNHKRSHKQAAKCKDCGKELLEQNLQFHMKMKHNKDASTYQCTVCPYVSCSNQNANRHKMVHSKERLSTHSTKTELKKNRNGGLISKGGYQGAIFPMQPKSNK